MVRPRKQTGPPGTPMPQSTGHRRPHERRTQPPQTPGLEAGAAYGEVSDSLAAQSAIPLRQKGPPGTPGTGMAPVSSPAPAAPGPLPLEAATGYTPQVTPLTAPGRGTARGVSRPAPTANQDAADLLMGWAQVMADPDLLESAIQLSV